MTIAEILSLGPVMPVVVIEAEADALALADALAEGGIHSVEITLRTPAALLAIEQIASHRPDMIVGAGTVLNADQAKSAKEAGARFAVSPGATAGLVAGCREVNLPLLPGASSVSEMMALAEQGFAVLKFFPATHAGGPGFLKALISPLPHLSFCPTGGITLATAGDWLALENVPCLGGSWVASPALLAQRDFGAIAENARQAARLGNG